MNYAHIFGPVLSRRLGLSLGIDLTPEKSCTLNCVYCECGKTDSLTLNRLEYVPTNEVISELTRFLSSSPTLDSITFSGSGEPTLHSGIGDIIAFLHCEFPQYPIAVLTNSSLLSLLEVSTALFPADCIIPSLDAVSETVFLKINRPVRGLTSAHLIEGLRTFCEEYSGKKWLEVFIIEGINDFPEELSLFRETLASLKVDRIQLNTLDRPGVLQSVRPVSYARLTEIAQALGPRVEVIASQRTAIQSACSKTNLRERILATIRVRPSTVKDLETTLGIPHNKILNQIDRLVADGLAIPKRGARGIYYVGKM